MQVKKYLHTSLPAYSLSYVSQQPSSEALKLHHDYHVDYLMSDIQLSHFQIFELLLGINTNPLPCSF